MLKIKLSGTTNELKWFKKLLERDCRCSIIDFSDISKRKKTSKYSRMYMNIVKVKVGKV